MSGRSSTRTSTSGVTRTSPRCGLAWGGISPSTITNGFISRWATAPPRRSTRRRGLEVTGCPCHRTFRDFVDDLTIRYGRSRGRTYPHGQAAGAAGRGGPWVLHPEGASPSSLPHSEVCCVHVPRDLWDVRHLAAVIDP